MRLLIRLTLPLPESEPNGWFSGVETFGFEKNDFSIMDWGLQHKTKINNQTLTCDAADFSSDCVSSCFTAKKLLFPSADSFERYGFPRFYKFCVKLFVMFGMIIVVKCAVTAWHETLELNTLSLPRRTCGRFTRFPHNFQEQDTQ